MLEIWFSLKNVSWKFLELSSLQSMSLQKFYFKKEQKTCLKNKSINTPQT